MPLRLLSSSCFCREQKEINLRSCDVTLTVEINNETLAMFQLLEYVDYWFFSAKLNLPFKLKMKLINKHF